MENDKSANISTRNSAENSNIGMSRITRNYAKEFRDLVQPSCASFVKMSLISRMSRITRRYLASRKHLADDRFPEEGMQRWSERWTRNGIITGEKG